MNTPGNKWWVVMNPYPEGDKPTHRHANKQAAVDEARRISLMTQRKIHVLELVGSWTPPPGEAKWEERKADKPTCSVRLNWQRVVFDVTCASEGGWVAIARSPAGLATQAEDIDSLRANALEAAQGYFDDSDVSVELILADPIGGAS